MKEKYHEYEKMNSVEGTLWWYRVLHLLIYRVIKRKYKGVDVSILDAGCGTGGMMRYLIERGYENVKGFDISKHAIEFSRESDLEVTQLDLLEFSESRLNNKFDVIISNDTLCYFDKPIDHRKILSNFYQNLNEGGIVVMNLPAMDRFKGIHDIAVGLKMRFTAEEFRSLVDSDMFEIEQLRYWPAALSPIIYIVRNNQRRKLREGKFEITSDVAIPVFPMNGIFYLVTWLETTVFKWAPVGSSLLVVLRKK